jgi:hypothetical protein
MCTLQESMDELHPWALYRAKAPRKGDEAGSLMSSTEAIAAECDFPWHSECYSHTGPRTLPLRTYLWPVDMKLSFQV